MAADPRALISAKLRYRDQRTDEFAAKLRQGHGREIVAIVFYGSLLSAQTRRPTSFHDFYVIIDSKETYYSRTRDRWLSAVFPPSIYYYIFRGEAGTQLRCKICVLTAEQLERETSSAAHDIHNMGRLSKRVAVVYARDERAFDLVVDAALQAGRTLRPLALSFLPAQFGLDDFIRMLLKLSYLGEQRIAEDSKVAALMEAELEYYRNLYGVLLAETGLTPDAAGLYSQWQPTEEAKAKTEDFLERSRRRGKMRWPKYILTVDSWLDILVDKIERHHGIKLELTERERRWPLIFGWPKYFALKRKGIVK